jgi:hypothetical protein
MSTKKQKRRAMDQVRKVEVALRRWDPIGVMIGEDSPADEYDSYAPHIVSMVERGSSLAQLIAHLCHLRTEIIGLPANIQLDTEAAEEIIRAIGRR